MSDKCTDSEKDIVKALHNTQIWTNIIYIIPSIFAFIIKEWKLGALGIVVSIISMLHHSFNFIDAKCIKESEHKHHQVLSVLDQSFASILSLYCVYLLYYKGRPFSYLFIALFTTFIIISIIMFVISSLYYGPKAEKSDVNSQDYIKYAGLYEHYHGYWHIFSGLCFVLTVLWLSI